MQVAIIVHDFDPTFGQGRYCVELARRIAPEHEVHVFANTFGVSPSEGLTFHRIPAFRATAISTILSFALVAESKLRLRNFDLVHAQGLVCARADVVTAHMCLAAKYREMPPSTIRDRVLPALITPLERFFFRRCGARRLVAVSKAVAGDLQREYGWGNAVDVIYHGTDMERFSPSEDSASRVEFRREVGIGGDDWVWLFAGEATKGLPTVLRVLRGFPDAKLMVVSRSKEAPYRNLAKNFGVSDRLHWAGFFTQPDKAYRAADVFVYPSPYDPFGMVVTEAMATGLPVVVSRHIGAAELIRNGETGFLCQHDVCESVDAPLRRLATEPGLSARVGSMARASLSPHSWERCAQETLAVFREVLDAKVH